MKPKAKARLGATEWLFVFGLLLLSIGVWLQFSPIWALIVCGIVLIFTAYFNAMQSGD